MLLTRPAILGAHVATFAVRSGSGLARHGPYFANQPVKTPSMPLVCLQLFICTHSVCSLLNGAAISEIEAAYAVVGLPL